MNKILILMFMIGITGCSVDQAQNHTVSKSKPNRVIVNTIPASKMIRVASFSTRYINDILEAYVEVQNLSMKNYEQTFEYRFRWFDKDNYEVGKNLSIWKPLFLSAHDGMKITSLAPTPEAESFKFYIREIRR